MLKAGVVKSVRGAVANDGADVLSVAGRSNEPFDGAALVDELATLSLEGGSTSALFEVAGVLVGCAAPLEGGNTSELAGEAGLATGLLFDGGRTSGLAVVLLPIESMGGTAAIRFSWFREQRAPRVIAGDGSADLQQPDP